MYRIRKRADGRFQFLNQTFDTFLQARAAMTRFVKSLSTERAKRRGVMLRRFDAGKDLYHA